MKPFRRQARFTAGRAILPEHASEHTWYDVCTGRRRGDERPGTVMLAFGGRREHVPVACLEFRAPLTIRGRALAAAVSLLPVAAAVIIALNRSGWHRHS